MTRPKTDQTLFQVVATVRETGRAIAVGPMMLKPYAEEFAAVINKTIIDGKERTWSNAAVAPMTPISAGAH